MSFRKEIRRPISIEEEIVINQFVQEINSIDYMLSWFDNYSISDKRSMIKNLFFLVVQSHPTYEEIRVSTDKINKSKMPAAVILLNERKPYAKFGHKIIDLPDYEIENSFIILLNVLKTADTRRKATESYCNHWWHKDLSDEDYLNELRKSWKTKN